VHQDDGKSAIAGIVHRQRSGRANHSDLAHK
jgi:hypothetical protein